MPDQLMLLPDQVTEIKIALAKYQAPKKTFTQVLVMGMGGSTLGAHLVKTLGFNALTVPFEYKNGYTIPDYANAKTLIILSSYSGNTEEVLSALKQARARKFNMVILTSGGELAAQAKAHNLPAVIFTTHANPSKQPRSGVLYNFAGILGILIKSGLMDLGSGYSKSPDPILAQMEASLSHMYKKHEDQATAKVLAKHLQSNIALLIASEHLEGNLHIFQNQLHETAKQFAFYDVLPEANHHLLESFKHPKNIAKNISVILIDSKKYHKQNRRRTQITADILKKQGARVHMLTLAGKNCLDDALELLLLSSQTAQLLASLNHEDPNHIPFVDELKKRLEHAE